MSINGRCNDGLDKELKFYNWTIKTKKGDIGVQGEGHGVVCVIYSRSIGDKRKGNSICKRRKVKNRKSKSEGKCLNMKKIEVLTQLPDDENERIMIVIH